MSTTTHQYAPLFRLKNLIQQIRLPWSCYAALGTILGVGIQDLYLAVTASLFLLPVIFLAKQKLNQTNTVIFLTCMLLTTSSYYYHDQKLIDFYANYAQKDLTIIGEIVALDSLALNPKQRVIKILVDQLAPTISTKNIPKFITIWANNTNQLRLGDYVLLNNIQTQQPKDANLAKSNLREQIPRMKLTNRSTYKILTRTKTSTVSRKIHNLKHRFFLKLKLKLSPITFNLLATIFLGHKRAGTPDETQQIRDQFQIWGLAHFLARAGLHMIIIALLIKLLLSALQVPIRVTSPIIIIIVLIYHQLSWPSVSFLRALYMVILYESCKLLDLQVDGLHLLNLIFISTLFINPAQIFFLDFQLSFALTYALVLAFRQNQYQSIASLTSTTV